MKTTSAPLLPVAACWMTAAAYTVGYGPDLAQPLGHAYAYARLHPRRREVRPLASSAGLLQFAGLHFGHPTDDGVYVRYRSPDRERYRAFTRERYRNDVLGRFDMHSALVADANTYLTRFDIEQLDTTELAWLVFHDHVNVCRGRVDVQHLLGWLRRELKAR